MNRRLFQTALVLSYVASGIFGGAAGQDNTASPDRIRVHTRHLSSDTLEGRAPGTRGEELTVAYLMDQFRQLEYEPGNPNGTFLQSVPLLGTTVTNSPELVLAQAAGSSDTTRLRYGTDFVAWTHHQRRSVALQNVELVFVGYGVVAPEYGWDDYKDVDVEGKYVVALVGDPPLPDPSMFGGPAMTYYGRWTYKFETASLRGAKGAIVVHTAAEAGYPWAVVTNSWTNEQFDVVRADGGASRCVVESWISAEAADRIFELAGRSFERSREAAASRDFRPYSLGLEGTVHIENELREVRSHNVVALLRGRDPQLQGEYVIYTAHWDHLGRGNPVDGDSIYNGGQDNASGVAGVLEVARLFSGSRNELKRSVLFVMTTAEESGLLGATHYVEHPLYPLGRTVAMINVDGLNVWGRTTDMVVIGAGQSDLDRYLADAVALQGRSLRSESEPEKGYYYRSDHFPFAKKGVPALYVSSGRHYRGRPDDWGTMKQQEYLSDRYHKPQDEYDPAWDFSGAAEDVEALYRVGLGIATSGVYPQWSQTSEFGEAGRHRVGEKNR
jgi:Zn-dependent M28 family amino/carboxypeptidase